MPTPIPRMSAYLAPLPNGLESYPACMVKGAVARPFLAGALTPAQVAEAGLPPPVAALLREAPLNSAWIPEVELWSALAAVVELRGFDDQAALDWFAQRDEEALTNPVLRLVMRFSSVEFLLPLSSGYWSMTHKGSKLEVERPSAQEAIIHLDYPPNLFDQNVAKLLTQAFAVPLRLSRATSVAVSLDDWKPTRATFRGKWS